MDNDNKDFELESQEMEPDTVAVEPVVEAVDSESQEAVPEFVEEEFDPTLSDEFYNNLEAAIGDIGENAAEDDIPELFLGADLFAVDEAEIARTPDSNTNSAMEDELFAGVDAALSERIEKEFGRREEISSTEEKEPNKFVSGLRAIPTWTKVLVTFILVVLISVGLLFGTAGGRKLIYEAIINLAFTIIPEDKEGTEDITPVPDDITTVVTPGPTIDPDQNPSITPEPTVDTEQNPSATPGSEPSASPDVTMTPAATPTPAIKIMDDENIINVLLLGEENMYGATLGRTDAIILVSINLNGGPLKLISFQRDTYVEIPGYGHNKLNAAYAYRGANLTISTIEQNFGIDVDSYVKVDFDGFENIIDQLGGLELSLTAKESEYLNTTQYISKPEERNTVAGKQRLTGAQVLGYCRIRYVPTAEGYKDDFGRTHRQRTVLKALFEQYKEKGLTSLTLSIGQCLQYVSAPAGLKDLALDCLTAVMENQMFEIETMQIPQNGKYTVRNDLKDKDGNYIDVLQPHLSNVDDLQNFLYGED